MRRRFRRALAVIITTSLVLALYALDWPTDSGSVPLTFGSGNRGRFVNGVVIASKDGTVRAAGTGDLFFYLEKPELADGFPSPLRAIVALEGADGMTSVYGGLEPGTVSSYLATVEKDDILGRVDRHSAGLYFSLYDRTKRRYVNPFIFMAPPKDERQPAIRSVGLMQGMKTWALGETKSVRQGTYELVAAIEDPDDLRPSGTVRAPYRIRVFLDGAERLSYVYETSEGRDGSLTYFGAGVTAAGFWKFDGRVSLGSYLLNRGKTSVLIVVKDYSGNEREAGFTFQVE
ncbi:MAG: hypothetical protein NT080_12930 [Spirochaetes bacterium]|nr:hypothetical protein [Spirochaetota bacterium]